MSHKKFGDVPRKESMMSKFDNLYPESTYVEFDGGQIYRSNTIGVCWHCHEKTFWVDLGFLDYLCSEECNRAKWEEYRKVLLGVVDIASVLNSRRKEEMKNDSVTCCNRR